MQDMNELLGDDDQPQNKDMKIKLLDELIEKIMMMDGESKEDEVAEGADPTLKIEKTVVTPDDSMMKDKLNKFQGI